MFGLSKGKKLKSDLIQWSEELMLGMIDSIQFLNKLLESKDHLKWFNKYADKNLFSNLEDTLTIRERCIDEINVRIFLYQLIESFLKSCNETYDIFIKEYLLYKKLEVQCPDWFQTDMGLLTEMYPNLKELLETNLFSEQITNDCHSKASKPNWLQNPEWPVIDGEIYVFESQTQLPEDLDYGEHSITYTFIDPKTNNKYNVVQYD